jgi:CRISPR-associated endoribonuclease Cas6
MRLKLQLNCRPNGVLSFNYHYALQAVIYRTLQTADPVFSHWLHEKGYEAYGKKRFKLFTFSDLNGLYKPNFQDQTLQFQTNSVEWIISFCVDTAMEKFISGLFQNQRLTVATPKGKIDFEVANIEIMETPVFAETMRFRAMMPICISENQEGRPQAKYLAPNEPNYDTLFLSNLANKYRASTGGLDVGLGISDVGNAPKSEILNPTSNTEGVLDVGLRMSDVGNYVKILSEPRKRGLDTVKAELNRPIKVIGYTYDFEISASIEWLKVGYAAGFGKSSSGGFGMGRIL